VESKIELRAETVLVPAGVFRMGDAEGRPDERPEHDVYVSAFRITTLPVTNRGYAAFVDATGHEPARFCDDPAFSLPEQPAVGVNWFDAVDYCSWLSDATGRRFRLPTEAEREKAARGGVGGLRYPWGDDPGPDGGRFEQSAPNAAGFSESNGFGLYDMGYNVHEWCSDWYDAAYYASPPPRDPGGPPSGTRRASRGGAWRHQIKISRCAARTSLNPSFRYNDYGFRVAESVP
jgi:formylglycine-generating enzyme